MNAALHPTWIDQKPILACVMGFSQDAAHGSWRKRSKQQSAGMDERDSAEGPSPADATHVSERLVDRMALRAKASASIFTFLLWQKRGPEVSGPKGEPGMVVK